MPFMTCNFSQVNVFLVTCWLIPLFGCACMAYVVEFHGVRASFYFVRGMVSGVWRCVSAVVYCFGICLRLNVVVIEHVPSRLVEWF